MDKQPKVSVIIPVYNVEKYLRPCLDSIIGQTLQDIEIICVDDGSTDSSLDILREYEAADSRVTVLCQQNINAGAARNKGLTIARGEYLSFLDSDDFFALDMLEKAYYSAKKTQAEVVVFRCDFYYQNTRQYGSADWTMKSQNLPKTQPFAGVDVERDIYGTFLGWPWDKLFLTSYIRELGLTFQSQRTTNDHLFVYSALTRARRIITLEDVLVHQRRSYGASLSVTREKSWDCFYKALCAHREQLKEWDLFSRFERDFVNHSLNFALWNLKTLSHPTQQRLFDQLKRAWFAELGITKHGEDYFYNEEEYHLFTRIMTEPYEQVFPPRQIHPKSDRIKVSVIMPSLNVGAYIRECMQSVVSQTLEDIEILCVDAGSDDGTLQVLEEFAHTDARITVIHSDKKSYGYQMNLGLDAAQGEYIGIVETDDWVEPDMFEKLWQTASARNADMVKCNYYWYRTKPEREDTPFENLALCPYGAVLSSSDRKTLLTVTPSIWSGLYKKEVLTRNGIRFHETPGASFQDTSFHFMVCTVSERICLIRDHLLHYCRDNDNSSVNSPGKVFCVSDELHYYESFLDAHPQCKAMLGGFPWALRYEKYRWNYERLAPQFQWEFLKLTYKEFSTAKEQGLLAEKDFPAPGWKALTRLLNNPIRYFQDTCKVYATRPRLGEIFPPQILTRSMVEAPKVSVIIPCYNAQEYLPETLDSVLSQAERQIELVCVNDGSTDDTLDILRAYAERDKRMTLITQINKGQSVARNVGIQEARGEFVLFLDSDDLLGPGAISMLCPRAKRDELDILYYNGCSFYETEQLRQQNPYYETAYAFSTQLPEVLTGRDFFCALHRDGKYRVSPCLGLYRRQMLLDKGLHFVEGMIYEDNLFTLTSMLSCQRVGHTQGQFLIRRVHAGSTVTAEKTFMNVYGYLSYLMGMLCFISTLPYEETLNLYLAEEVNNACNHIRVNYSALKDKAACRGKLSAVELRLLDAVVLGPGVPAPQSRGTDEAAAIRASATYKIGRLITFVPRKLRGGIRCFQEHGLRYTLGRVRFKLRRLFGGR